MSINYRGDSYKSGIENDIMNTMAKGYHHSHRKPSEKQLEVIRLIQNDIKPAQAARMAGYSENTIKNLSKNVLNRPIVKSLLDNYRYQLDEHGITPHRLAEKMSQLLEAKKPVINMKTGEVITEVEDTRIQLDTAKELHNVWGIRQETMNENNPNLKRKITLEEFSAQEFGE